jgi:propanediol utilization protein
VAKKDKDEKQSEHPHTGSVVPEDEALTKEISRLWSRNEGPERIEVWQVFGKEKRDRGEMIFHEDYPLGKKLDVEQANHLANEIIAAAQNDCDATPKRREAYYQIAIVDRNRRAVPLIRRLGPLRPKRQLALVRDGEIAEADMDDEELSVRTLEHNRLKTGFEEIHWGTNRNDRVLGELLMLMGSIIQEQRDETRSLRGEVREERKARDEAEDRRMQREMMLEEKRFSIGLKKEALRMGRNLLPGLFSEAREEPQIQGNNGNGNGHAQPQPSYGRSGERALVDNFMTDCEDEAGLMEKLFGEAEEQDGKLVVMKPGIFTPKQALIFIGVRGGFLPVEALDPLMPESGDPVSITMQQVSQAQDAGITEGMGMALIELKAMRERAREKNTTPPTTNPPTKNPAPTAAT